MDPKFPKDLKAERNYLCDSEQKVWWQYLRLMHRMGLKTPRALTWTFPKVQLGG